MTIRNTKNSLNLSSIPFYALMLVTLVCSTLQVEAQDEVQFELDFQWQDTTLVASSAHLNTYNEVWGFVQDGIEYAVMGSTFGTHIFDLSSPSTEPIHNIAGAHMGAGVVHRDYHDYQGHLYAVCDEGASISTLQIFDLSYLPDSVAVVYDSKDLFTTTHNIFIDTSSARLYASGGLTSDFLGFGVLVFDITEPANPQLIYEWNDFYVHDLYVRNDTAYMNIEQNGLMITDFSNIDSVQNLGRLETYTSFGQGYNHSGWLTDDGKRYVMADENWGLKMKMVNVENNDDLFVESAFGVETDDGLDIPHNQMIIGDYLYASYYTHGTQIYNIAKPDSIYNAGSFQTSSEIPGEYYRGNWGVYCYLPSNKILLSDMQEGLFVLNATYPDTTTFVDTTLLGTTMLNSAANEVFVYPNPVIDKFELSWDGQSAPVEIHLLDVNGRILKQWNNQLGAQKRQLEIPADLSSGIYFLAFTIEGKKKMHQLFVE